MKKIFMIILMVIFGFNALKSQEITHLTDSSLAETILKKYIKMRFVRDIFDLSRYSEEIVLNRYLGQSLIQNTIFALGDWALKPDYKVYKSYYKSPWVSYSMYMLYFPEHTPKNDSMGALYTFRDMRRGQVKDVYIYNPIGGYTSIAYNSKTGNLKEASPLSLTLYREGDREKFKKINPNYTYFKDSNDSERKGDLLYPQTHEEIENMLRSELMKNIYSYRMIKSGLFDSLTEGKSLKKGVELFPLLDSLLPDFQENLCMDAHEIFDMDGYYFWLFYYPGIDFLYKGDSSRISHTWEKYLPLEPCYYALAYEKSRQLVHFVSGKNIFLTRFVQSSFKGFDYIPQPVYSAEDSAYSRRSLVYYRTLSLCSNYPFYAEHNSINQIGEDKDYWFYDVYTEMPIITPKIGNEFGVRKMFFPISIWKKCHYKVRMSKSNMDIVEVVEILDCKEEKGRTIKSIRE